MKNNKIYILAFLVSIGLVFNSCDVNTEEYKSVSPVDSFVTTSMSVVVPETATEYEIEVVVMASEVYTADRAVPILVSGISTANGLEYSFNGNVDIAAGQATGSTMIQLDTDLVSSSGEKTIVLELQSTSEQITITYIKECIANKLEFTLDFDNFSGETSWELTENVSGSVVATSGGTYAAGLDSITETFLLPDGDYTFTIMDSFGDGICCSWGVGAYSLSKPSCAGGDILASGATFGFSETTFFSLP